LLAKGEPQSDDCVPADVRRPLPDGWYGHLHNIYLQFAAERGILTASYVLIDSRKQLPI